MVMGMISHLFNIQTIKSNNNNNHKKYMQRDSSRKIIFNPVQEYDSSYSENSDYVDVPALRYTYSGISNSSTSSFYLHHTRSFQQGDRIKFLNVEQLAQSMEKLTKSLYDKMSISQHLILYLLYKYKWNKQKLEDQYYGFFSAEFMYKDNILQSTPRKPHSKQQTCSVCLLPGNLIKADFCEHCYCSYCWNNYIESKLNNNELFFGCMNACVESPILQPFIKSINPQLIDLYLKRLGMNYCLANKNITYCPSAECSIFCQKPQYVSESKVECPCGNIYCFYCRKQTHIPVKCDDVIKWQEMVNKQSNNCEWIAKNTAICPQCKNNVQKSLGCDLIKCFCSCQFCFNCSLKWDEAHKVRKQCPKSEIKLSKILSKDQKKFIHVYQKIMNIRNNEKKDVHTIQQCIKAVNELRSYGKYENQLAGLKNQLKQASTILKWGIVGNYLHGEYQQDNHLENDLDQSIYSLVELIKDVLRMHTKMTPKQLHNSIDQILTRKRKMEKCMTTFIQSWRS